MLFRDLTYAVVCALVSQVVPPVALILFMAGLAYYAFFNAPGSPVDPRPVGIGLMSFGASVLFLAAAVGTCAFIHALSNYADDYKGMIFYEVALRLGFDVDDEKRTGTHPDQRAAKERSATTVGKEDTEEEEEGADSGSGAARA